MAYQNSLFSLEVMQDHSGRCAAYPAPPKTRAECESGREARALPPEDPRAERCQCFGCPYNLIGEIGRIKSGSAMERAFTRRYEEGVWDTCLLDVLDPDPNGTGIPLDDTLTGALLGISGERVAQVVANAAFRFRKAYALENKSAEMIEAARAAERVKIAPEQKERPLTRKQQEAIDMVNACGGNVSEAARRLGVDHTSVRGRLKAARYEF